MFHRTVKYEMIWKKAMEMSQNLTRIRIYLLLWKLEKSQQCVHDTIKNIRKYL